MLRSILNYILKREAYQKFKQLQNLPNTKKVNFLQTLVILVYCLIWGAYCIALMRETSLWLGAAIFFIPIGFIKAVYHFISSNKVTKPIYSEVAIYKADRRFKSGSRISHFEWRKSGVQLLSDQELEVSKRYNKNQLYKWGSIFAISVAISIALKGEFVSLEDPQLKDQKHLIVKYVQGNDSFQAVKIDTLIPILDSAALASNLFLNKLDAEIKMSDQKAEGYNKKASYWEKLFEKEDFKKIGDQNLSVKNLAKQKADSLHNLENLNRNYSTETGKIKTEIFDRSAVSYNEGNYKLFLCKYKVGNTAYTQTFVFNSNLDRIYLKF